MESSATVHEKQGSARGPGKPWPIRLLRWFGWLLALLLLLAALVAAALWWGMWRSRPVADGQIAAPGLEAPVAIARDADGNATISGKSRRDVAFALGWLHAQERLFQMDLLRRLAAGELSEISGSLTADIDRRIRVHRFRARAAAMVAAMAPQERALLDAYVAGVNRGRADLGGAPFEYLLTFSEVRPWVAADTLLAVTAMAINLQPAVPQRELDRARATQRLGPAMAAFLYPSSTELDAPMDGSILPEPPLPDALAAADAPPIPAPALPFAPAPEDIRPPHEVGSNNWAVGGRLTASGAALVANDMHLGLSVPSTWYRARMIVVPAPGSAERPIDVAGVTLPGTPFLVAGSNGRVAWGFTNSNIDAADAVIVDWIDVQAGRYRVPGGSATVRRVAERLCLRGTCERLDVAETIWGPVVGTDAFGRTLAMRWTAHNGDAVKLGPALALERATTVAEALALAQASAIPQQNFTVGDSSGAIGWTVIGQVPRRFGFDGQEAVSFADGAKGWAEMLAPAEVPRLVNPPSARIWTANARVVGGDALALLGDGGYAPGSRAGRIRDLLLARERFAPADFLAIQLDDRAVSNRFWQALLLREIAARPGDAALQALKPAVATWGERAAPGATGYRLVAKFKELAIDGLYDAYMGEPAEGAMRDSFAPYQGEGPARRLLRARPAALVPPGSAGWTAFLDTLLAALAADVAAAGGVAHYGWGAEAGAPGRAGVSHPLGRALAPLGWAINPRDRAVAGDRGTVRAQARGFGASQRFAVSPGHERDGLFHMPGGQAGNPLAPWYLGGHVDWVEGRPAPFLPGPAKWRVQLQPVAGKPGAVEKRGG